MNYLVIYKEKFYYANIICFDDLKLFERKLIRIIRLTDMLELQKAGDLFSESVWKEVKKWNGPNAD